MGRTVKKLSGLEIDEVSLVDRPANQHGLVTIAKRQEDTMPDIFDAQGNEVDEDQLEHGDVVYDDAGNEFVFVEGEVGDDDGSQYENDPRDQYAEVGKAGAPAAATSWLTGAGKKVEDTVNQARKSKFGQHVGRNKFAYTGGMVGAAGLGIGYVLKKSLGQEVLEQLSKSLTDTDRDEVIAKALDVVDQVAQRNAYLEDVVAGIIEDRQAGDYVELAKGYELPGDEDTIGGLMYRASQSLPEQDVVLLDRLFSSYGEIAKGGGYEQIGYDGYAESDALSQVFAAAGEVVSKSDQLVTQEQAVTALFAANPAAYDEYEAEQRYQR